MYLEAMRRLGIATPAAARRALVVEDAAHGLAAARAAGAYAVAVPTSLPEEALAARADEVLPGEGEGGGLRALAARLATMRPREAAGGGSGGGGDAAAAVTAATPDAVAAVV